MKHPSIAIFLSSWLALSLTACPATKVPLVSQSLTPAPKSSPMAAVTTQNVQAVKPGARLQLRIQADAQLQSFRVKNQGVCLGLIQQVTTSLEGLDAETLTRMHEKGFEVVNQRLILRSEANLSRLVQGLVFNLDTLPAGKLIFTTTLLGENADVLGELTFDTVLDSEAQNVNLVLRPVKGQVTTQSCPVLAPDLDGASLQRAGGGVVMDIDTVLTPPEPASSPEPEPSGSPAPSASPLSALQAPVSLQVAARSTDTLTLLWSFEEKTNHSYTLFLDGKVVASDITRPHFTFTGLSPSQTYKMALKAVSANNESPLVELSGETTASGRQGTGGFGGSSGGGAPPPVQTVAQLELNALQPPQGLSGSVITLTGQHFGATVGDNQVQFGGVPATVISANATELKVKVPELQPGTVPVSVSAGGTTSAVHNFEVKALSLGFVLNGGLRSDNIPRKTANFGDINGDGINDILFSSSRADHNGVVNVGKIYVIYGGTLASGEFNLADLQNPKDTHGFILRGSNVTDEMGMSLSAIGDINGDGRPDIMTSSRQMINSQQIQTGVAYVIYGGALSQGELDLNTLPTGNGSQGFAIEGDTFIMNFGESVHGAGDLNQDGIPDLMVSATNDTSNGAIGNVFVIYGGNPSALQSLTDIRNGDASKGFMISGNLQGNLLGQALEHGDFNGDGITDLVLANSNRITIVYGGPQPWQNMNLSEITQGDGSKGFFIDHSGGFSPFEGKPMAVKDLNGDGKDDLLLGRTGGKSYVLYGGAVTGPTFDLGDLEQGDGSKGFVLLPETPNTNFGISITGVDDFNGDGKPEILVGDNSAEVPGEGAEGRAYLIYGGSMTGPTFSMTSLVNGDGSLGFVLNGFDTGTGQRMGGILEELGDINGDGKPDFGVGANRASKTETRIGQYFVLHGGAFKGAVLNLKDLLNP